MDAIKTIKAALAAAGGTIAYWLGGFDQLLIALVALIVLDYVTGVLKSCYLGSLSSNVGFRGISKKVMMLGVVTLAHILDLLMNHTTPIREITIVFFVANEGISVLENAASMGIPLPRKLKKVLSQLTEQR